MVTRGFSPLACNRVSEKTGLPLRLNAQFPHQGVVMARLQFARNRISSAVLFVGCWLCPTPVCLADVVVNGVALEPANLALAGRAVADGRYWYDAMTGAWGYEGQGTAGFIAPGLALGGHLREDASQGRSGVFINGRQLPDGDVVALMQMGIPVQQGRWWVDAFGNAGAEGGPALFNLRAIARQSAGQRGGADSIYSTWGSGDNKSSTWIGADGSLSQSTTINGKTYDYYIGD